MGEGRAAWLEKKKGVTIKDMGFLFGMIKMS